MQTATNTSFTGPLNHKPRATNWTSIRLLNVYRLGLSAIFFSQNFVSDSALLNITNQGLFTWLSSGYLLLAMLWMLAAKIERREFRLQFSLQIYGDTIFLILLMHACGGISSGLGMLLIISMIVAGLVVERSTAIIFASLASLGLLSEFLYANIYLTSYSGSSAQVGILGATLFAAALVTHRLSERIRRSERQVLQGERDVALLSAMNQKIIENLQAGVVVLTQNNQIRHINKSASKMLGISVDDSVSLAHDLPKVLAVLETWKKSRNRGAPYLPTETGLDNIEISFRRLPGQQQENILIFVNDVSSIKNRMQQARLASLDHLTASIAHEIRNPLSAISHAAQLLSENNDLSETDRRMTEIIHQHSDRINHIIKDILDISRGAAAETEEIDLSEWLTRFIDSFCLGNQTSHDYFDLAVDPNHASILFDSGHLTQIMTNLCANARMHGDIDKPLHIRVYMDNKFPISIEIADEGPGIDRYTLDKIFEPFFTTSHQGSGLGLYIVDQLCELNDATILVRPNNHGGSSFIIHPRAALKSQHRQVSNL